MAVLILAMICGVLAIACAVISVMQFREKGFLFNNAYIWASRQEREKMEKKPYYRHSAIAFALCGTLFLAMAMECLFVTGWLWGIVGLLAAAVLVYAIVSSSKEQTT